MPVTCSSGSRSISRIWTCWSARAAEVRHRQVVQTRPRCWAMDERKLACERSMIKCGEPLLRIEQLLGWEFSDAKRDMGEIQKNRDQRPSYIAATRARVLVLATGDRGRMWDIRNEAYCGHQYCSESGSVAVFRASRSCRRLLSQRGAALRTGWSLKPVGFSDWAPAQVSQQLQKSSKPRIAN